MQLTIDVLNNYLQVIIIVDIRTRTQESMSSLSCREALRLCEKTTDIDEIIDLTKHESPQVRQKALKEICPCRVKEDVDDFWNRVLEMLDDPATNVRHQVCYIIYNL